MEVDFRRIRLFGAIASAFAACAAYAGAEWSGNDLMLRGEDGVAYTHEVSEGESLAAGNLYISYNDCGARLVADGGTISATVAHLGYQNKTSLTSNVSLALTNAVMTLSGSLAVTAVSAGSAALTLGPGGELTASSVNNNSGVDLNVFFDGGRLKATGSSGVFAPQGLVWRKSNDSWTQGWPNRVIYVSANEGPVDITVTRDVSLVNGYAGRAVYLRGTRGFVKRGTGVLDWVWYPSANNGRIDGNATYTGDTVVKEGGIRVGDTYTYQPSGSGDRRTLHNSTPPQSPLVLEANTFLDVSSNVSTWCSISGAGVVTNRTTKQRGKVVLGGTVADCTLAPASVGGMVDVYKRGSGTLTIDTSGIDGDVVVSNGTVRVASGSTLAVRRIVLLPNTTLDARGATLKNVVIDLNGRTVGFETVADAFATADAAAGGTLTFGEDGSDATLNAAAEAGVKLVKKGGGTLALAAAGSHGDLTLAGGQAVYVTPQPQPYRHYRFKIDAVYSAAAAGVQLSEFRLLQDGTDVTGLRSGASFAPQKVATTYPPDFAVDTCYYNEDAAKCIDGSVSTKWLDYRGSGSRIAAEGDDLYVQVDFADAVRITHYSWATANDSAPGATSSCRDPLSWRLLASDDGETWDVLDERAGMGPYAARKAWVGDFAVTYPESRLDRARTFGAVTVEAGATLDLRGEGFACRGLANRGGTILRDAATAIALTAAEGTEVGLKSGGSRIEGDVAKTGAGTNTVCGVWAVDGSVTVSNGTLRCLADGFGGKFFRMTITKNNGASGWTQFGEFYLYDRDGQVIDDGRPYTRAAVGSDPATLQERQACERIQHTDYDAERIEKAFDDRLFVPGTTHALKFAAKMTPTEENPIVFSFRMPANTPRVYGYNFVEANDCNGTRNPVSWKFEGSADGVTWRTLDERADAQTPDENSTIDTKTGIVTPVFFNDGVPYDITGAGDPGAGDELAFGESAVVSVLGDGVLSFDSAKMELAALSVDTEAGCGTIERFTPATNGVLYVTTARDVRTLCDEGPVTLFAVADLQQPRRLRAWTVVANGEPKPTLCVRSVPGRLVLKNRDGLAVIVK